jgi:hypothetical protein
MNIEYFNNSINRIENTIVNAKKTLQASHDFPNLVRVQFNKSLMDLLNLLNKDTLKMNMYDEDWYLAHSIVRIRRLHKKISKIYQIIFKLRCPPYFTKKIQYQILPSLERKIDEMNRSIGSTRRLPFAIDGVRDEFLKTVKDRLELSNTYDTKDAEKEYFHFLGNSLDRQEVRKKIDVRSYEGMYEIYSFISWSKAISIFIREGNEAEAFIGKILLETLQKGMSIALKSTYAYKLLQTRLNDVAQENSYYKDFVEFNKEQESTFQNSVSHAVNFFNNDFFEKYTLKRNSAFIPRRVIMNEIAWDIIEAIRKMHQHESRIFALGSHTHRIIIEITCMELPSYSHPHGKYKYEIFNTGNGVDQFHRLKTVDGKEKVHPIIFHDIPSEAFFYDFIFKLVQFSLQKSTIEEFYQLHDEVLVKQFKARKDLESGKLHLVQYFGICSYLSVEAWLDSYLTEDQIKHLELIKAKFSTNKLQKVIRVFERRLKEDERSGIAGKGDKSHFASTRRNLEDDRFLLKLGENHLKFLEKT